MPLDRSANLHTLLCIDSRLERFPQSSFAAACDFFKHYISLFSVKLKWGARGEPSLKWGAMAPLDPLGATTARGPLFFAHAEQSIATPLVVA